MGMTHPSHTPPHPSSMTCITGYTTSRTESATGHPHTDPPTGAAHTSHKLLAHTLSRCIQNTAHNNTEIFPGFLLPDLHLTLSALGEMSRSPVKGSVAISHNVSKWKPCVWLAVSGKWEVGRGKEPELKEGLQLSQLWVSSTENCGFSFFFSSKIFN